MPGWADVAKLRQTVVFRDEPRDVKPLDLQTIADLIERFPELRKMIESRNFEIKGLLLKGEEAANAIIVAGTGAPDDVVSDMTLGEKVAFLAGIVKMTMPGGVGPFVELASAFGLLSKEEAEGLASSTSSALPSSS